MSLVKGAVADPVAPVIDALLLPFVIPASNQATPSISISSCD